MRNPGTDSGFTLLELMISIASLSVVVLIVAGSMRLAYRSVDAGEKKIESLERLRASLNIIDSQIQSTIPLVSDEDEAKKYYFKGDRNSVRFASNYSIWGGQKGYVLVTYRITTDGGGKSSLLATENLIGMAGTAETRLMDKLDDARFEYFYKDPTEEEGKWVEMWTKDSEMPEMVKVNITFEKIKLPLIIQMRAKGGLTPLFGDMMGIGMGMGK